MGTSLRAFHVTASLLHGVMDVKRELTIENDTQRRVFSGMTS